MKFLAIMPLKKGGAYGAALTGKAADAQPANRSRGSLKTHGIVYAAGRGPQPAPGLTRDGVRGRPRYKTDADRQTARRIRYQALGLNTQGKPYQRHPNFVNHAETPRIKNSQINARRARKLKTNLDNYRSRAGRHRAHGLRVDGKPFRRRSVKRQWQQLRATIAVPPQSFEDACRDITSRAYK